MYSNMNTNTFQSHEYFFDSIHEYIDHQYFRLSFICQWHISIHIYTDKICHKHRQSHCPINCNTRLSPVKGLDKWKQIKAEKREPGGELLYDASWKIKTALLQNEY